MEFGSPAFWVAVLQIIAIDILLGGDNAVVIALASRRLPPTHRNKAIFWGVKYAVPHMQKSGGGSIVNLASVHGLLMAPNKLAYETGKSAVIGVTKQMAIDFGPLGIRVNAICPGHIVTERIQKHWEQNPSHFRMIEAQYPVRRAGKPDDIANAIHFLCSDEASFITGHSLVVDGGLTIQLQEDFGNYMARFYRDHPDTDLPEN